MRVVQTVTMLLAALVAMEMSVADSRAAQPQLVVQVTSGREFSGEMDEASSPQQLVIRSSHGGVTVTRSIDWQRIVTAKLDGNPIKIAQLQELAREAGAKARIKARPSRGAKVTMRGLTAKSEPLPAPQPPQMPPPQATTVAFDSAIANWDADVETDGLVIDLAAVDANGYLVPADGTLQVELFAPQRRVFQHASQSGGDTLELVERWTRAVTAEDFGPSGARIRLPYGAVHPELEPDWLASSYGLVHVQLAMPGHGVFEDSRDGVRIQPWAPNRDNLEMNTGRRFLPTERLGRRD